MGSILIVDDEFGIVEAIQDLLQDEGYATRSAFNGRQALDILARERPLLVLLDDMMPVMDGQTLLSAMKRIPALSGIPVIMMSANRPDSWRELTCAAFLAKPFNLMQLLTVVHRFAGPPPPKPEEG